MQLYSCILTVLLPSIVVLSKTTKRGLAYADQNYSADFKSIYNTTAKVISWQYDWGSSSPDYRNGTGIEYIPMQWGENGIEAFSATVKNQKARAILGFNEPDLAGQYNFNATYAATLWKKYINPLTNSGILLGAPAVTNGLSGRPWLVEFLLACFGCEIDFIPIHWYGTDAGNFYDYISQMHGQFPQSPLWVTEFASTSSNVTEVAVFMDATTRYLDTLDWIERYCWFAFFVSSHFPHWPARMLKVNHSAKKVDLITVRIDDLLDENGALNTLGKIYMGVA